MNNPFHDYLILLDQLRGELEKLTNLAQEKAKTVRNADLNALDEVLKQEQAIALSFRGLEQKQASLLNTTGLVGVPLSSLVDNYPPKMRLEAKQVVERLQSKYKLYTTSPDVARNTLECNLHEIEKILSALGAPETNGPGYEDQAPQPPSSMKTDFRV
jgi:hypothetical protein